MTRAAKSAEELLIPSPLGGAALVVPLRVTCFRESDLDGPTPPIGNEPHDLPFSFAPPSVFSASVDATPSSHVRHQWLRHLPGPRFGWPGLPHLPLSALPELALSSDQPKEPLTCRESCTVSTAKPSLSIHRPRRRPFRSAPSAAPLFLGASTGPIAPVLLLIWVR